MFKSTLHQSSVKANNLDDNNDYLLNNNENCYKISFSQNSSWNSLSLSSSQDYWD